MELVFENLQKKVALNPPQILKIAKTILRHEGVHQASLSLVFVSYQRIKALNKKFLRRDYATDVLAFDTDDRMSFSPKAGRRSKTVSGDVIISTDAALKNARTYQTSLSEELALYVIHGILHLLGFDDHKEADVRKMRTKERQLLASLGPAARKLIKNK